MKNGPHCSLIQEFKCLPASYQEGVGGRGTKEGVWGEGDRGGPCTDGVHTIIHLFIHSFVRPTHSE